MARIAVRSRRRDARLLREWERYAARSRGKGVGRALVEAAEVIASEAGRTEIASDAEIENEGSISAHRALGFDEIESVGCFRKSLRRG
ncbi:MAG TPA: GNAT family N-acetyltransferase [Polyangiaceae bacterium]|nr:GNAT family N-acetyltransferase [Polyangiaceae bacterium]